MAEWGRDTPWRQGHVLPHDAATALGLLNPESPGDTLVVVISHDCDLASNPTGEPHVEVIIARRIEEADGNCTHSKNARKLHLEFMNQGGSVLAELQTTAKTFVAKEQLVEFQPHPDISLEANGRSILQRWLAARYRRAAFPDEFDQRLKTAKLDRKIAKLLEPHGNLIRAIFFIVDDGEEILHQGPDDTYTLDIVVLHTTDPDPDQGFAAAEMVCREIEVAFKDKLHNQEKGWRNIELRDCIPMSDESLTVRQSDSMKEWRLEYMSLRQDPNQPMLAQ